MEANQDILNAYRELSAQQQSVLQRVVDEYKAACELAQGRILAGPIIGRLEPGTLKII